jgi:hypothetical protein
MEHEKIKALLEKYWVAETTIEEEKQLAAYFQGADVDPALEAYRPFFEYIEEEKQVAPGAGFEARILERVGLAEAPAPLRRLSFSYAAAAALILCISSLFLVLQLSRNTEDGGRTAAAPPVVAVTAIKDTYDDPGLALAAVRRALLVASTHMNEGKNITQKNMHRLNNSWQAATGN